MLSSLATIFVLHWAVLLIPGINFVMLGRLAAGGSRASAVAAVGGMTSATLMWAALAVLGVGAVFSAHPLVRQAVQVAGGLYLLYLAIRLWRAQGAIAVAAPAVLSPAAAWRAGFLTSALNPKIALFYGSVFATALPPAPSPWLIAAAVTLVYLNSVLWHGFLAVALSHAAVQRRYAHHGTALNRIAGVLIGGFGLKLLVATVQELRQRAG